MTATISNQLCPDCGTPVPHAAAEGLCPRCLARAAVDTADQPGRGTVDLAEHFAARRFFGDYELLGEVARGGMGIVFKARQLGVNRIVALKVLAGGAAAGREFVHRFHNEAASAARLEHPHIVPIYEFGEHEGTHFLAMRFLEGGTLQSRVAKEIPAPAEAARTIITLASAVEHAHRRGVLHRDLKPGNVLLDGAGAPHVADFGLARVMEDEDTLTLSRAVIGTAAYLAPEIAGGGAACATVGSDIYGLGAILYELLTGRPPFGGATVGHTLRAVQDAEPIRPGQIRSAVPSDLETICLKCLEKEPAKRYATAQGLADDLGRFLNGEPVHARPVTGVERAWRWCRRKPALALASVLVLVLLLVVAIGAPIATFRVNRERLRAEAAANNETHFRRQAEAQAYTSDMNVVQQVWEEGDLHRAQELLHAHVPKPGQPDLRGFEWRYLWNLCQDESLRTVQLDQNDPVWNLASTPAHSFVAACCDKTIRLLDPATGRELDRFSYPNPEATKTWHSIALASGATNLLAAHRADGQVGLWDVASRKLLMTFKAFPNNVAVLALSPDGRHLAAAEKGDLSGTLTLWDISAQPQPSAQPLWSHYLDEVITAIAFSPDGQTVVAAKSLRSANCGTWETRSGNELKPFPKVSAGNIVALAFSPDGSLLACSGVESRINVPDFNNRTLKFTFDGHSGDVVSLSFSPDGQRLISSGSDATIRIWDIPSQKAVGMLRTTQDDHLRASFAPNGKTILTTGGKALKIWNSEPRPFPSVIETERAWGWPAISPDGKWLVTTDSPGSTNSVLRSAKVWDITSRREKFYLASKERNPLALAFSPDGRFFALADLGRDGVIGIWDTADWKVASSRVEPIGYLTNNFEAGSICFSPDGKILAAAGLLFITDQPSHATNRLAFWEVGSWKKLNLLPGAGAGLTEEAAAASVAFSNNGRLVAIGSRDGWVRLWDFKQQRLIKEFNTRDRSGFGAVVRFSRDDRWLASVSMGGTNVALFDLVDAEHPRAIISLKPSSGGTWWAMFAPDNKSLVTHSNDGLIKFWNLQTLSVALALRHGHGPGGFLSFASDGNLLASEDAHGTVKLWPAPSFEIISQKERARK